MNLGEVNALFEDLRDRLDNGELIMDDCVDYEMWSDEKKWSFNQAQTKIRKFDFNDDIIGLMNQMNEYRSSDNNNFSKYEIRDKLKTAISVITSRKFLSDDDLDDLCTGGFRKLIKLLNEIHQKTLYLNPTAESYIKLSSEYRNLALRKLSKSSIDMGKDFQRWKNRHLEFDVDDLVEYRGKLIKVLLNSDVCKGCENEFRVKDTDALKYRNELRECDELSELDNVLFKRYAYFRRIFAFDGKLYRIIDEAKLGKHIYMNRYLLTDDDICSFYHTITMIQNVQKEMVFEEARPADNDREGILWYNLRKAGIVDYEYQPISLDLEERGVLAKEIANALHISNVWSYSAKKWNADKEQIRKAYDRKMKKVGTSELMNKYQKAIGLD